MISHKGITTGPMHVLRACKENTAGAAFSFHEKKKCLGQKKSAIHITWPRKKKYEEGGEPFFILRFILGYFSFFCGKEQQHLDLTL